MQAIVHFLLFYWVYGVLATVVGFFLKPRPNASKVSPKSCLLIWLLTWLLTAVVAFLTASALADSTIASHYVAAAGLLIPVAIGSLFARQLFNSTRRKTDRAGFE